MFQICLSLEPILQDSPYRSVVYLITASACDRHTTHCPSGAAFMHTQTAKTNSEGIGYKTFQRNCGKINHNIIKISSNN